MIKKEIFAEIILIVASVFIFRSLWEILDGIAIMNNTSILFMSFLAGILLAILALSYLIRKK